MKYNFKENGLEIRLVYDTPKAMIEFLQFKYKPTIVNIINDAKKLLEDKSDNLLINFIIDNLNNAEYYNKFTSKIIFSFIENKPDKIIGENKTFDGSDKRNIDELILDSFNSQIESKIEELVKSVSKNYNKLYERNRVFDNNEAKEMIELLLNSDHIIYKEIIDVYKYGVIGIKFNIPSIINKGDKLISSNSVVYSEDNK